MKCPTPLKVQTSDDGFRYIAVGESGRGRKLAKVPVAREFPDDLKAVEAVDVCPATSGRTVILRPESDPSDRRALVILPDRSGFRGGCSWYAGAVAPPERREPGYDAPAGDWEAYRAYKRERDDMLDRVTLRAPADFSRGPVWFPAGEGRVAVVAEGARAQGGAGHMGGGPELLVIMEPGTAVTVHRTGRLYGNPDREVWTWDGATLRRQSWADYENTTGCAEAVAAAW